MKMFCRYFFILRLITTEHNEFSILIRINIGSWMVLGYIYVHSYLFEIPYAWGATASDYQYICLIVIG